MRSITKVITFGILVIKALVNKAYNESYMYNLSYTSLRFFNLLLRAG
jgi:hypothetical protein